MLIPDYLWGQKRFHTNESSGFQDLGIFFNLQGFSP